jgi:quercetin dioxygenase-like cupin family protein
MKILTPMIRAMVLAGILSVATGVHAQTSEAASAPAPTVQPIQSKILLRTQTSWDGKPLSFKAGPMEMTAIYIEIAPGAQTGWHQHPVPSFAYMLDGELEVSIRDGRSNHLKAGDAVAEVVSVLHNGRNPSPTQPAKLVVFYTGGIGIPLTIADPAAAGK